MQIEGEQDNTGQIELAMAVAVSDKVLKKQWEDLTGQNGKLPFRKN